MANLGVPPIHGQLVDSNGVPSRFWAKWFADLFQSLGGSTGAGASFITVRLPDVTSLTPAYVVLPRACKVMQVDSCLQATVGFAETITVSSPATGTLGTIAIDNGSVAGTVDRLVPTANQIIPAGSTIKLVSAGATNNSIPSVFTITTQYLG